MNILIPMAGEGSRFKIKGYELPKPLIKINGKSMIQTAIETLNIAGQYIFVVRKYEDDEHRLRLRKILEDTVDNPIIYEIDYLTDGATATCLLAREVIKLCFRF